MDIYGFLSLIGTELVLGLIVFWAFIMAPELRALERRIAGRIRYDVRAGMIFLRKISRQSSVVSRQSSVVSRKSSEGGEVQ